MLRPVRMTLVNLLLLKEDLPQAMRALTESECLQVEAPRMLSQREELRRIDTGDAIGGLEALRGRIEEIAETLGVDRRHRRFDISDLRVDPKGIRAAIEDECTGLEQKVRRISRQIERDREALWRVELTAWVVSALEERQVDPILVTGPVYIGARIGTLPSENFARTRRAMDVAGHELYDLGTLGNRTFVASVTTADRVDEMANGLRGARFEPISIRQDLVSEGRFDTHAAELAMWETHERLTENSLEIIRLARASENDIARWLAEIALNMKILEAMNSFLEGDYTCLVTGWVPVRNLKFLRERLEDRCENPVETAAVSEEEMEVEGTAGLRPPTKLLNPRFLRPFEVVIDLYGTPEYNALNPTLFVAFTFVFIFGAMFGDLGHGLVLALLGSAVWFLGGRRGTRDMGFVIGCCGLSSAIFGLLYGEVFGNEMHAWWQHPMEDPAGFLVYGVILGAVIINIGLLINIAQNLWSGRYKEAWFGEWGISTLLFYWAAIFLFAMVSFGHSHRVSWLLVLGLVAPPLAATAFGAQIVDRITGRPAEEDLPSAVFRPIELMLASLTNTISFVRVPAFALNHIALMSSIFLLAGLIQGQGMSARFFSWVDLVVGNVVVIALEGLIVLVQTMRLHYYEFFGKFFHHQGHPFKPLSLED